MKVSNLNIKKSRIEMLPLIDIVFLLLVFFIYAMLSMAVHRSLPVALPTSSIAEINTRQMISITLKKNGTIYVDEMPIDLNNLSTLLVDKKKETTKTGISLFADRSLTYQSLYNVLDIIKQSGIEDIALQADAAP